MPFKYNISFPGAREGAIPATEEGAAKIFTRSLYLARLALKEEAELLDIPELDALTVEVVVGLKADASGS
jgi:hypothetical protein